ncbi:MAG TPA: hypothetical protein VLT84_12755, partial [Acidobacteriota bacterium]|nr:hypothetical protein [Acidobacteriota bacterium]
MRGSLRLILLLALLSQAPPAAAQFMYLDSDGDGLYTVGESLTPATTAVDVWLDTEHNRDASNTACNSSSASLTIGSYSFCAANRGVADGIRGQLLVRDHE